MAFARILEARIKGELHGSQTINVIHFGSNEAAADNEALVALMVQLATAIILCAIQQLIPAATSDWTLVGVDVKQLHPAVSDPIEVAADAGTVGEAGTVNTSFEAILMRRKTGGGGRKGRGRNFLPPPGDVHLANSLLSAGSSANFYSGFIQCLTAKFLGSGATENYRIGVLSRTWLKTHPSDFDTAFRECTELAIEQRVSCLRSRKLGHGA